MQVILYSFTRRWARLQCQARVWVSVYPRVSCVWYVETRPVGNITVYWHVTAVVGSSRGVCDVNLYTGKFLQRFSVNKL